MNEYIVVRKKLREEGKKVVFTNGCFDIIHRGHLEYLYEAKSLGDYLVIGLNSDTSVQKLKGKGRPVNKQEDRAFVLSGLKPVDAVLLFSEDTPYDLIKSVEPDILVKGGDWKENEIVGNDIVNSYGGKVLSLKFVSSYSTTSLIDRIKSVTS